jgi:PIN domain nuclease of toxin-antitoxin system
MNLLLDTVTFLRAALGEEFLSPGAKQLLVDPENRRFLSPISACEIVIKSRAGKLGLPESPESFVPKHREALALEVLAFDEASALHMARLPDIHRDPFDRILISQALVHGMVLVTPDRTISRYPVRTAW